ncbi:MAG: hypothetical protein HRU12_23150 [Phaeodactylibacter sp.]|nr:hypothetical protein [Phaeodactylibacter sp.]
MKDSALYCVVGDVIGYTDRAYRWEVVNTISCSVTVRRIESDGTLARCNMLVQYNALSRMVIYEYKHGRCVEKFTVVSSLDYMSNDELSDKDKQIIKEALL